MLVLWAALSACPRASAPRIAVAAPTLAWAAASPPAPPQVYGSGEAAAHGWTVTWARGLEGEAATCRAEDPGRGWTTLEGCDPGPADPGTGTWGLVTSDDEVIEAGHYLGDSRTGGQSLPHLRAVTWDLHACGPEGARATRTVEPGPTDRVIEASLRCGDHAWDLAAYGSIEAVFAAGGRLYVVAREPGEVRLVELASEARVVRRAPLPAAGSGEDGG